MQSDIDNPFSRALAKFRDTLNPELEEAFRISTLDDVYDAVRQGVQKTQIQPGLLRKPSLSRTNASPGKLARTSLSDYATSLTSLYDPLNRLDTGGRLGLWWF